MIGKSVVVVNRAVIESSLARGDDLIFFSVQEKLHYANRKVWQNAYVTVPQTDTGGLVEKTKVIGRQRIKELGKKARRNLWEMPRRIISIRPQQKFIWRLFI